MYAPGGGERYLVIDAQVHAWDASPHNQAIPAGEVYALDLMRRHCELDGSAVPPYEVERVSEEGILRDVFEAGYVDRAVLQPVVLDDLFVLGFSPLAWHAEMADVLPDRFVLSGELDPDGGHPAARGIGTKVRRLGLRGITLCERLRPAGRMHLDDPWLRRVLTRCGQAGADVVHIGVGPSSLPAPWRRDDLGQAMTARPGRRHRMPGPGPRVPSWAVPVRAGSAQPVRTRAAARVAPPGFDVGQFRDLAGVLPQIRFVLGAGCLPGELLCRLGRLPNVYVMLTELLPWTGSHGFDHAFGALLTAFGAERLLFGSGYPLVRPGRLVRDLAAYQFPAKDLDRYPVFDATAVRAVLGGNAARLYRIPCVESSHRGMSLAGA